MSRPASALAVALTAVVLAACGSSSKSNTAAAPAAPSTPNTASTATTAGNGYTAAVKRDFLAGCEQKTPTAACECMFAYVQAHVPYDKLRADVTKNKQNSQYVQKAAHSCVKK